jgi:hypothetical protein
MLEQLFSFLSPDNVKKLHAALNKSARIKADVQEGKYAAR